MSEAAIAPAAPRIAGSLVVATVIGDVVASRRSEDRAGLHARLAEALSVINQRHRPVIPLRITLGDEFQGAFATVGGALAATLRLRLLADPDFDLRHGVGWGMVTVLSEDPPVEDGPGWWSAREAIETVPAAGTAYRRAADDGPDPAAVNAALITRDALLDGAAPRSRGVLHGLLNGMSQSEIARVEGVSASAVSQRVRRDGLQALVASDALLGEVR